MKQVSTVKDLVRILSALSMDEIKLVGSALTRYDPCHAERLRNSIMVEQQEMNQADLDQEKQYEQMSRAADEAYVDYAYNDLEH